VKFFGNYSLRQAVSSVNPIYPTPCIAWRELH